MNPTPKTESLPRTLFIVRVVRFGMRMATRGRGALRKRTARLEKQARRVARRRGRGPLGYITSASAAVRARLARLEKDAFREWRLSPGGYKVLKAAMFALAPRETSRRRQMARRYNLQFADRLMTADTGSTLLPPGYFGQFAAVAETCAKLFAVKKQKLDQMAATEDAYRSLKVKRTFLKNLLSNDDLQRHPELVEFALSDSLLGIVTGYLGVIPYLNRIDLLYSVASPSDEHAASQLFHLDPEGLSQAKLFLNLIDVGDEEGPFTFIPANETSRILAEVKAGRRARGERAVGRYLDSEIAAVGGTDAIVTVRGPAGSSAIVDTSRCLHCGSRVRPGAFRLCLYIQYCTSREAGNVFDVERFRKDPVRFLAVRHSLASAGRAVTAPHQMAG